MGEGARVALRPELRDAVRVLLARPGAHPSDRAVSSPRWRRLLGLARRDPRSIAEVARRAGALPAFFDWSAFLGITPDGDVVAVEYEWPFRVEPVARPELVQLVLVDAADTYPELAELRPRRSPSCIECAGCRGAGVPAAAEREPALRGRVRCACGGLGFLVPLAELLGPARPPVGGERAGVRTEPQDDRRSWMLILLLAAALLAGDAPTLETARTQAELSRAAGAERLAARRELERQSERLVELAKGDPRQLGRLRRAQEAWEAFRAAEMEARLGCEDLLLNYGSAASMCSATAEAELLAARASPLRAMADSAAAGDADVCRSRPTCAP